MEHLGTVTQFDPTKRVGSIRGDDGLPYQFCFAHCAQKGMRPKRGERLSFLVALVPKEALLDGRRHIAYELRPIPFVPQGA